MASRMHHGSKLCLHSWLLMAAMVGCKETSHSAHGDAHQEQTVKPEITVESYAADAIYLQKNSNFFSRIWDMQFVRRLDDLPRQAEVPVERRPYSGSYYANLNGGTNVRTTSDAQTIMQKYDAAFHGASRQAELWEKCNQGPVDCAVCNNSTGQCQDSNPSRAVGWAGHCNGFAAAAQRHREPTRDVTRNGVVFRPQDIKGLLAEVYLSADFEFLGGTRCESNNPGVRRNRENVEVMGECEDMNPGTMHAVLGNWIGRAKHALVMDMSRDEQVWNYPIYKFDVQQLDRDLTAQQALALLSSSGGNYKFNPTAVKFAKATTKITYANADARESLGVLTPYAITVEYLLELNSNGEIVGGEWIGSSETKHPDFVWVALEPLAPNGTKYMGNPHIDTTAVLSMWAESAGFDPQNPPLGIRRPADALTWGKWPSFEVSLDGNQRGAVFSGKPAILEVARKGSLASGNIELELALNGNPLTKLTGEGAAPLRHSFEPGLGLNRLQFLWRKDGTQVEEQYLRFHVVR